MQEFDLSPKGALLFGPGALARLGELACQCLARRRGFSTNGHSSILLITDPGVAEAGIAKRGADALLAAGLAPTVFADVQENPTTYQVEAGVEQARRVGTTELIVGLGGGSAMDCAKAVNFLLTNGGSMEDYWGKDKAPNPMLPSIGVPTTAGTGSESQSYALITQPSTGRKMACGDKKASFSGVVLDPLLLASVPTRAAATAGIDALAHALESYVCKSRNTVSRMLARQAWSLLEPSLEPHLRQPDDAQIAGRMLLGAHLAGESVEASMLGAAHACANPLTREVGLTHGLAVGLMLPHVIRFNSAGGVRYDGFSDRPSLATADELATWLSGFMERLELPSTLAACGVQRFRLRRLAQKATEEWTARFNPRPLTESDFQSLYEAAF